MKSRVLNVTGGLVALILAMGACAGTSLNDVGDLDGNLSGTGGTGDGSSLDPDEGGTNGSEGGTNGSEGGKKAIPPPGTGGTSALPLGGKGGQPEPSVGGTGGLDSGPGFVCETCEVVAETPDIRAIWAASDKLYWIEYGSLDALGNYQGDGRLLSLAYDDDEPTVVAGDLPGPIQLAVTEDYAYFILEQSDSVEGAVQLARISVGGGDIQLLQALPSDPDARHVLDGTLYTALDWFRTYFAAGGAYVFWRNADVIYRLTENSEDPPQWFRLAGDSTSLLADDSLLYLHDAGGLSSVPFAGGMPSPLWASTRSLNFTPMVLVGDFFYAHEFGEQEFLGKLPKVGGLFTRLGESPSPWAARIETDGTSYVADFATRGDLGAEPSLREGNVAEPSTARTLATAPAWSDEHDTPQFRWRAWAATPTSVYIGYGDQLYRAARQP